MCQLRLTLDELTAWLASLDLRKPHKTRILSHFKVKSEDASRLIPLQANTQGSLVPEIPTLKGVRVREWGRGQPMNNLIVQKAASRQSKTK